METTTTNPTLILSNSAIDTFQQCPRAFDYTYNHNRVQAHGGAGMNFGSCIHRALETKYRLGEDYPHLDAEVQQAFVDEYNKHEFAPDEYRSVQYGLDLLRQYDSTYPLETWDVIKVDDKPLVETPFYVFLGTVLGHDVFYKGVIDLIVRDEGVVKIVDHKTTSMMGSGYFDEYILSAQMIGYCYSVGKLLKLECNKVLINAICTRKPTKTGKGIEFNRDTKTYTPDELHEWEFNTLKEAELILQAKSEGLYVQHKRNCVGKFGKCSFFDVCSVPAPSREYVLQSNLYKAKDITPFE